MIEVPVDATLGRRAVRVGTGRHRANGKHGHTGSMGMDVENVGLHNDIVGAVGELAVARVGGYEDDYVEVVRNPKLLCGDVGPGWEVRATQWRTGNLLMRRHDTDDRPFILVRLHRVVFSAEASPTGVAEIIGWQWGAIAKDERHFCTPQSDTRVEFPCYLYPAYKLQRGLPLR